MAIGLLVWVRDRSQLLKLEQCCCQCRDVLWLECIIELPWRHRFAAAAAAADSDMLGYMSRAVVRPTVNVGVQSIARTHSIQSAITVSEHLVVRLYETLHQSSHFRLVFHARKKNNKVMLRETAVSKWDCIFFPWIQTLAWMSLLHVRLKLEVSDLSKQIHLSSIFVVYVLHAFSWRETRELALRWRTKGKHYCNG